MIDRMRENAVLIGFSDNMERQILLNGLAEKLDIEIQWQSFLAYDEASIVKLIDDNHPILLDVNFILDELEEDVSSLFDLLCFRKASIAVLTDFNNLEKIYGILSGAHIVVGDDPAETMFAMSLLRRGNKMGKLFDPHSSEENESLSKISSDLLEFARTISRIAQAEASGELSKEHLADKPIGFRGSPFIESSPFLPSGSPAEAGLSAQKIRDLIRMRRIRDRFFKAELFADPAWDILLDLMAARIDRQKVSVSSLCIAAAVPATTALRWIKTMTDEGILERRADPTDARRIYIQMSDSSAEKMAEYLQLRFKS